MLSSTVKWCSSTSQIPSQTSRHHNIPSLLTILPMPHVVDGQLKRIIRRSKIHIVYPPVRLLQLACSIKLILEELVLVLSNACVDEDVVDVAESLHASFESVALAAPVGNVTLQGENAVGFEELLGCLLCIGLLSI